MIVRLLCGVKKLVRESECDGRAKWVDLCESRVRRSELMICETGINWIVISIRMGIYNLIKIRLDLRTQSRWWLRLRESLLVKRGL
jgi:hypothetical protein